MHLFDRRVLESPKIMRKNDHDVVASTTETPVAKLNAKDVFTTYAKASVKRGLDVEVFHVGAMMYRP